MVAPSLNLSTEGVDTLVKGPGTCPKHELTSVFEIVFNPVNEFIRS